MRTVYTILRCFLVHAAVAVKLFHLFRRALVSILLHKCIGINTLT